MMKKTYLNKISKIALLFLMITFIGGFCFQIISANQSHGMPMGEFSPAQGGSNKMMPCCGDNGGHLMLFDLPPSKALLQLLSLAMAVVIVGAILICRNFSTVSYSLLAPPGPDLLLTVIKRE